MKLVAAILVTAIVSASATYLVTGKSKTVEQERLVEAQTDDKDQQISKLKKDLNAALADAGRIEVIETAVSVPGVVTNPADLIDKLAADEATGEDAESQRRVIHYFESLVDAGNNSVPAINAFLDQQKDREFGRPSFRQRLQITNSQVEEFRTLNEKIRPQMGEKMREIWGNQEISREERGEQMRAYFEDIRAQYTELMTESQRAQIEEMGEDGQRAIRSMIGGFGGRGPDRR